MARDQDANDRTMVERIDPLLGSVLDRRYKIDFRLAAGGFGAIYRATHIKSGHEVALKVLHPQLTADAGVVARFRREGATMTTLRSPHTITAYELGEAEDGTLYIVMELLRGESLFERFRAHGRFDWKRMVRIARAICDSLGEAHRLGIVHRDLKPTNIHLEAKGEDPDFVKVLDFGIAKILRDSDFDSSDLTNAGQMIGTLDYMSPEQMVGGTCTGQSDIYTLGILTYEMIAGVRPFAEAQTAAAALAAILRTVPPPLSKRTPVPDELDRIIARCLERDPLQRYATVDELAGELDGLIAAQDVDEVTRTVAIDPSELGPGGTLNSITPAPAVKVAPLPPVVRPRPPSAPPPVPTSGEYTWKGDAPRSDSGRTKAPTGMPRPEPVEPPFSAQPTTPNPVIPRAAAPRRTPTASPLPRPETDYAVTTPVPKFSRAPTTPPTGMPSASPFKTTLPGAQMPPNPNARPSQPQFSPLPHQPPPPYAPSPSYPHTPAPVASYVPSPFPPPQAPRFPPTPMAGQGQNVPRTPMAGQQPYPPGQNFPPTPMAGQGNFPPTPMAGQGNFPPTPMAGQPYAPQPIDDGRGSRPILDLNAFPQHRMPQQGGYPQQPGGTAFDMGHLQARDAAMRRFVWIAVLIVGAIVGIVLAARM